MQKTFLYDPKAMTLGSRQFEKKRTSPSLFCQFTHSSSAPRPITKISPFPEELQLPRLEKERKTWYLIIYHRGKSYYRIATILSSLQRLHQKFCYCHISRPTSQSPVIHNTPSLTLSLAVHLPPVWDISFQNKMTAICSGRPTPDNPCFDRSQNRVTPSLLAVLKTVRNFLFQRPNSPILAPSLGHGTQREQVELAQRYMSARLAGRTEEVLRLVSDDVRLESSRDGKVEGREQFRKYLTRVKPIGTWKAATWNREIGKAEILGSVRIFLVNISVVARMGFNRAGKINEIYVGTRGKAKSDQLGKQGSSM